MTATFLYVTRRSIRIIALVSCGLVSIANADDALLIGGGTEPSSSEGQIELNVRWVQQVLEESGIEVTTWFTDGSAAGADVVSRAPKDESTTLEPLSRIFGDRDLDVLRYREHEVPKVAGGTDASTLIPTLVERLSTDTDPLLLIYNGHGGPSPDNPAGVTLNLWNNTSVSAEELHSTLRARNAPVRWILTQCFSGGFHRLAYEDPNTGLALPETPRCGFTSESAYRLAEGCSASLDIGDYRDYTSFFFAAISGYERNGEIIDKDPDLNGDSITSPREAHLYTLEHAYSSDLSRSTSEDFLDEWQPWYLRWLPLRKQLPNNEYATLYRDLAARLGVTLSSDTPKLIRSEIAELQTEHATHQGTRTSLREQEVQLQAVIKNELAKRWPALLGPYTQGYNDLAESGELQRIAGEIASTPDYIDLLTLQNKDDALDAPLLDSERAVVQRQKLLRLRRLAHLVEQLDRHGDADSQRSYASLVSCEEAPLTR